MLPLNLALLRQGLRLIATRDGGCAKWMPASADMAASEMACEPAPAAEYVDGAGADGEVAALAKPGAPPQRHLAGGALTARARCQRLA